MSLPTLQWSVTLPNVESEALDEIAGACPGIVVLIWAVWDPACQAFDKMLSQSQSVFPNLHFYAMDLDQKANWSTARGWNVLDTRTIVFLLDGIFQESLVVQHHDASAEKKLDEWNAAVERHSA